MEENITKALHDVQFLDKDLREIYKKAIDKNNALVVLAKEMIEKAAEIATILSQLKKV